MERVISESRWLVLLPVTFLFSRFTYPGTALTDYYGSYLAILRLKLESMLYIGRLRGWNKHSYMQTKYRG